MGTRYVYRPDDPRSNENGMIDAQLAVPAGVDPHMYIITDTMEPTKHMATGEMFTSKAAFRQRTRDVGCVEVGNDSSLTQPRKPVQLSKEQRIRDIQRAVEQLRNR